MWSGPGRCSCFSSLEQLCICLFCWQCSQALNKSPWLLTDLFKTNYEYPLAFPSFWCGPKVNFSSSLQMHLQAKSNTGPAAALRSCPHRCLLVKDPRVCPNRCLCVKRHLFLWIKSLWVSTCFSQRPPGRYSIHTGGEKGIHSAHHSADLSHSCVSMCASVFV